eukprot:TRINITY_DN3105_c0_g1_i23.p1 TRINITY_DN3105_c0_g1~~TRINITY_DN3105_c0_g1_i23.p1  ORF type:complete len:402 (-),score=30.72 TRINITY_DN3105_c0_g1_i23:302-1507(-)
MSNTMMSVMKQKDRDSMLTVNSMTKARNLSIMMSESSSTQIVHQHHTTEDQPTPVHEAVPYQPMISSAVMHRDAPEDERAGQVNVPFFISEPSKMPLKKAPSKLLSPRHIATHSETSLRVLASPSNHEKSTTLGEGALSRISSISVSSKSQLNSLAAFGNRIIDDTKSPRNLVIAAKATKVLSKLPLERVGSIDGLTSRTQAHNVQYTGSLLKESKFSESLERIPRGEKGSPTATQTERVYSELAGPFKNEKLQPKAPLHVHTFRAVDKLMDDWSLDPSGVSPRILFRTKNAVASMTTLVSAPKIGNSVNGVPNNYHVARLRALRPINGLITEKERSFLQNSTQNAIPQGSTGQTTRKPSNIDILSGLSITSKAVASNRQRVVLKKHFNGLWFLTCFFNGS